VIFLEKYIPLFPLEEMSLKQKDAIRLLNTVEKQGSIISPKGEEMLNYENRFWRAFKYIKNAILQGVQINVINKRFVVNMSDGDYILKGAA